VRLGIWLPLVHHTPPYVSADWELRGDPDDLAAVVSAADSFGFDWLFAPEHVALPAAKKDTRGECYWDPISTLGFVAAHTKRIGLVPLVFVASYHHPLEVAKRMATLDRLCRNRVSTGIGVGSLVEEFELLGANFRERGRRTDDFVKAYMAARGVRTPEYAGEFFRFSGMTVDPTLRADMPIWIGGLSPVSIKRALRWADAWAPTRMPLDKLAAALADPENRALAAQRKRPLEVVYLASGIELDAIRNPDRSIEYMRKLSKAGVTALGPELVHTTRDHYIEQLQVMATLAAKID